MEKELEKHDIDALLNGASVADALSREMNVTLTTAMKLIEQTNQAEYRPAKADFYRHAKEAMNAIENSQADSATSRIRDMLANFETYQSGANGIIFQLSKLIASIGRWYGITSNLDVQLRGIHSDIIGGKVLVVGDEDIKKVTEMIITSLIDGGYVVKQPEVLE